MAKNLDPKQLKALTERFRKAGAPDPETWARSELAEGIPQLAIFCFAKALVMGLVSAENPSWIDRRMKGSRSKGPDGEVARALKDMVAKGVERETIAQLVRRMQEDILFRVCALLDGSLVENLPVSDWALHQMDDQGEPVATIQGLHEVIEDMFRLAK